MAASGVTKILQRPATSRASRIKQTILAPFVAARATIFEAAHPPHVFFYYMRNYMRLLGLWPGVAWAEDRCYYACNAVIMLLVGAFVCTITCDLYDAAGDIVLFGEDLVVALGVSAFGRRPMPTIIRQLYLILFKIWLFRCRRGDIDAIIAAYDALHARYARHGEMRRRRRVFFMGEFGTFVAFIALALLLFAAMSAQPLLSSHQLLPFRAKFPFELDNPERHPRCFLAIYVFQCCCLMYMLLAIVIMDSVGGNAFSQTTVNLTVLCVRIRELGRGGAVCTQRCVPSAEMWRQLRDAVEFHQHLISLNERINAIYYWNYVSQMGASTFMICLTAFEALLAQDQPMVAMKFQMYMFSAFMQLFYWCWMGNMTYFESMEVATAALEMHGWYEQTPRFQRNLMFLIQRAQKPLEFRARPFYAFNFASFTSILSTSYSYFALLRTMND